MELYVRTQQISSGTQAEQISPLLKRFDDNF